MEMETDGLRAVENALDVLRGGIEADGGEIVVSDDGSGIQVVLRFSPDTCADCILPEDILISMVNDALEEVVLQELPIAVTVETP